MWILYLRFSPDTKELSIVNVFDLDRVLVSDYERFARSFTQIKAADIRSQVEKICTSAIGAEPGKQEGSRRKRFQAVFLFLGQPPHRLHPFALALVAVILIAEIEYLTFWHKNPTAQAILQMASWKPHSDRHYGIGQASRHNRMVVNAHVIIAKFPCD
jgi:hypothetical protein